MPALAEMLVSQSPPIYSHSLADYIASQTDSGSPFSRYGSAVIPQTRSYCRPASLQLTPPPLRRQPTPFSPLSTKMPASPKRSCLVVRVEDLTPEEERTIDLHSPTDIHDKIRNKKKVVFADDQGGQLTQVRVMKEPSYMPPVWSLQFLAHVTQGMISPVPQEQWVVDFRQPASAYLEFRQKVEDHNVSLENVIIKETEHLIVGTVKVKNVSYNKEVVVRSSCDGWKTHEDTYCTYTVVGTGIASAYMVHDTFSFKITLPPKSRRIEFCVCYRCDIGEFWDNNNGHNYSLTNRVMPRQESSIFFPTHNAFRDRVNNGGNINSTSHTSSTNNSTNGFSSNTTSIDSTTSYVDPTVELDTWRHMTAENHSGPYCLPGILKKTQQSELAPAQTITAKQQPSDNPIGNLTETPKPEVTPPQSDSVDGSFDPDLSPLPRTTGGTPSKVPIVSPKRANTNLTLNAINGSMRRHSTIHLSSCGDEFTRSLQKPVRSCSTPRDTGRQYFIRERSDGDDLLSNLLSLREMLLGQNVHG
ncbi:protein phosphatase 1 regulatory subunit 3C-B [Wyeomyia smithii]|uniref:protein phosphatase 1 regulatory subunit 3C-B n=1 Tax=Wyeomyia smithii TaxID=174621 RepID=UPI0024680C33|nr:protein phosphatase 1 regulatory subunit 3C-B [Wyeomyia smithii]